MLRLTHWHSLALLVAIGSLLSMGCGGAKTAITAPEVPGQELTNPNPGGGVDGSYVPYIPPPTNPNTDPIPAFTDPGMTNQNGQNTSPGDLDPVYDPNDRGGIDLTIQIETGGGSGFSVEVEGDDGKTTIFTNTGGGMAPPMFSGETPGPTFDALTGKLVIPLQPTDPGMSVYLTVTTLDGQGQSNESHTITLPAGWTPVDFLGGGTGAQMF